LPSTSSSAPPEPGRPRRAPLIALAVVIVLVVAVITVFAVSSGDGSSSSSRPANGSGAGSEKVTPSVDTSGSAEIGSPAPAFVLETLDGHSVSLASLRGKPVIVNFWASWCNPCRHEFPLLRKTVKRYRLDELTVVGISYQDIDSDARRFAKEEHATWPLAVDVDGAAAKVYGVRSVPTTFFVTPEGTIADRVFGELPTGREFQTSLDKILQVHALGGS
jgi:cytochrome c biogenesis protein CcmG, thiol:disulfide interchange protein DsbE